MKVVGFVDSVLQDRPYVEQCDEMVNLIQEKNAQIEKYTQDFWRVHRRSIKYYAFEFIWAFLIIPFVMAAVILGETVGIIPAALTFFLGAALVVYGEMVLVTRQLRDLKSKKLIPSLISTLIGIRHSMCSTAVLTKEGTKKYQTYFKQAEKRFMLTVTEVEAVKYAKENVTEKVLSNLTEGGMQLRRKKDRQAQEYYEKFHHYRQQCLKYGALEAFVALMIIPVYAIAISLSEALGIDLLEEFINLGYLGIAILIEYILIRRHLHVARRKELYLLIYQKLSVIISDYTVFTEAERLSQEFENLERSIVQAADLDNMRDVSIFVRTVMGR